MTAFSRRLLWPGPALAAIGCIATGLLIANAQTPVRTAPTPAVPALAAKYPWLAQYDPAQALHKRIAPPEGFARVPSQAGSFTDWLRNLPLKPGNPPVLLHNGSPKAFQRGHAAVVDIDVGEKDLQQCADAVIRLRAEYLFSAGRRDDIHFNFTSGDRADWAHWAKGFRPSVSGNRVSWSQSAKPQDNYASFRQYLNTVFLYAGTASLEKELIPTDVGTIRPGEVFIQGGSPGHACIVLDVAANAAGQRVFLLAQSYMPAQEIEVLKNLADAGLSPWFDVGFPDKLTTPEWVFERKHLRRFAE